MEGTDVVDCACGSNALTWRAVGDAEDREGSHTLEEARAIGGAVRFDGDGGISDDDLAERRRREAERNGVEAFCAECHGSMEPGSPRDEVVERIIDG